MRALLDLVVERGVVERGDPLGLGGLDHADEARPFAGQRHQRERPALGVEFGRGVVVRPGVREIEGQRGLRIGAAVALDAGGGAAERAPSIGADDEAGGDAVAAFERDRSRRTRSVSTARASSSIRVSDGSVRARASSAASRCRFSILWPNASSPISDAAKRTSGARTSRAVASTIRMTRSGAACACAAVPDPERLQRGHGTGQQRGGAMVRRPAAARSARSRCRPPPTQSPRSARPGRRPRSPLRRLMALP